MFLGHFGVGFGAKAAAPRTSLGALFLAAQFIDLLWPTLLLLVYASSLFGTLPPSATAIAWVGQAQWLLVLWAFWIDRHRESVNAPAADPFSGGVQR